MKWLSHLAAVFLGVGIGDLADTFGMPEFGDNLWLEGIFWLAISMVLLLAHLYEKRRSGGSPAEST